jgi:hypothetical protein
MSYVTENAKIVIGNAPHRFAIKAEIAEANMSRPPIGNGNMTPQGTARMICNIP